MAAASFWDAVSVALTVAVFFGVAGESVADFETLARWTRLDTRPKLRKAIAKASLLVLIVALALEVVAAIGSHNANERVIGLLNKELSDTIERSIELTKLTQSLGLSNDALKRQLEELVTPRRLNTSQADSLLDRLKLHANTPFDVCVANDSDSIDLFKQLIAILQQAGWSWKPSPSIGILALNLVGKPQVCIFTTQGIRIEIAEGNRPHLERPALALRDGLISSGIRATASRVADDKMDAKFDHSVVHLFIGTK